MLCQIICTLLAICKTKTVFCNDCARMLRSFTLIKVTTRILELSYRENNINERSYSNVEILHNIRFYCQLIVRYINKKAIRRTTMRVDVDVAGCA